MFETFLIVDNGVNGAALLGRLGTSDPEILLPPFTWWHRRSDVYDRKKQEIHNYVRFIIQEHHPRFLVMEKPKNIMGRKHVVGSQAWKGAEIALVAASYPNPPELIQVDGVGPGRAAEGWQVLRSSFAEILGRDELAELAGPKGENVRDCCGIFLRGIEAWEQMRRAAR